MSAGTAAPAREHSSRWNILESLGMLDCLTLAGSAVMSSNQQPAVVAATFPGKTWREIHHVRGRPKRDNA